jgi:uncharacterized protein
MFAFLSRLLLFFVVISVIRSVVSAVLRAFRGNETPATQQKPPDAATGSASTLLHQDPVCGTYVPAGSSLRKICKGQVFHFCSEACRDRYQA